MRSYLLPAYRKTRLVGAALGGASGASAALWPAGGAQFNFIGGKRYAFTDIPGETSSGGVNGTVVRDGVIVRTTALDDDFTGYADQAAAEAAGWTQEGTDWTFDAANDKWTFGGSGVRETLYRDFTTVIGDSYVVEVTLAGSGNAEVFIDLSGGLGTKDVNLGFVVAGTHTLQFTATSTTTSVNVRPNTASTTELTSVTVSRADTLPRIGDDGLLVEGAATRLTTYPQDQTGWNSVGALSTTLDVVDGFERRRVASDGASWHRQERALSEALAGGEVRWVRARYELGTSGKVRVIYRNSTASTETGVYGTPDNLATFANAGALSGLQSIDLGSGVYEVVFAVTVAQASTSSRVGIGPESTVVGEDVIVHGAQLTDAPSSWIISDPSGTPTRTADSVTLTDLDALGLTSAVLGELDVPLDDDFSEYANKAAAETDGWSDLGGSFAISANGLEATTSGFLAASKAFTCVVGETYSATIVMSAASASTGRIYVNDAENASSPEVNNNFLPAGSTTTVVFTATATTMYVLPSTATDGQTATFDSITIRRAEPLGGYTVVVEWDAAPSGGNQIALSVDDGGSDNRNQFGSDGNAGSVSVGSASGGVANYFDTDTGFTRPYKQAGRFASNDSKVYANGTLTTTDAGFVMPVGLDRIRLGRDRVNTAYLNGFIRRLTIIPRAVSDAELQSLSS